MKEWVGEMVKSVGGAIGGSAGDKYAVTAVVQVFRVKIESTKAMVGPSGSDKGGLVYNT